MDEKAALHEKVQHGATAAHLAKYTEEVLLPQQEGAIRSQIFALIDSEMPLNPQQAVQAWIELRSAYRLVKTLKKAQKTGETANLRLSEIHEEEEQTS